MEENNKNEIKKETTKKKLKITNKKRLLVCCGIVVIILIVAIILIINFSNRNKVIIKTATNEIDMSNLENVEIIDGKKINNSERIKVRERAENLSFQVKELTATSNESKLVMEVTNESEEEFLGAQITIVFTGKEGRKYAEVESYVGKVDASETIQVELTTTLDITNAYDYKVRINKANI